MIQINFKIVRNGFNVCNVTYGNYNSFEDAAKQISKEATELPTHLTNNVPRGTWGCCIGL